MSVAIASIAHGESSTLRIAGADRMVELLERLSSEYRMVHPDFAVEVNGGGSGIAMFSLASGKADLVAMARIADASEVQRAERMLKTSVVGVPVAMDAVVFTVHASTPLEALTVAQIDQIFAQKLVKWGELNVPYEDAKLVKYGLGTQSGSRGVLSVQGMGGRGLTTDIKPLKTSREVIEAVAQQQAGFGFSGLADTAIVRVVPVKPTVDAAAVYPTLETVHDRTYPFAHYVYLYHTGSPSSATREFVAFVVSPKGQDIIQEAKLGPIPLPRRRP